MLTFLKEKIKLSQLLRVDQRYWVWSAYWRLWVILLRIKLSNASWVLKQVDFGSSKQQSMLISCPRILAMHEAVRLAARLHFMSAACLACSLVLHDMLTRSGYQSKVYIGVANKQEGIASHAWVEVNGEMVGEPKSTGFNFTPLN